MNNITYKFYTVIGLIILAVTIVFGNTARSSPETLYPTAFFEIRDDDSTQLWRNHAIERSRAVTADDIETIDDYEMISVELTLVSVTRDTQILDSRGVLSYETYTMIGTDSTGALWNVFIFRDHISEPEPLITYSEGQRVTVYGGFSGDTFYGETFERIPKIHEDFTVIAE